MKNIKKYFAINPVVFLIILSIPIHFISEYILKARSHRTKGQETDIKSFKSLKCDVNFESCIVKYVLWYEMNWYTEYYSENNWIYCKILIYVFHLPHPHLVVSDTLKKRF